jgi:hypothetical protein
MSTRCCKETKAWLRRLDPSKRRRFSRQSKGLSTDQNCARNAGQTAHFAARPLARGGVHDVCLLAHRAFASQS